MVMGLLQFWRRRFLKKHFLPVFGSVWAGSWVWPDHFVIFWSKVTTFIDSLGMTFYSQIIYFIALKPTVKKKLSIKISIFYTSAVLKLLQQKYKLHEDAIRKPNKGPL
jgi:hypothetical protein